MSRAKRPTDRLGEVGQRLRAARESLGLRTIDVCAEINVQPNTYSQWETGARLLDVLAASRLAERFAITLDWLYRGDAAGLPHGLASRVLAAMAKLEAESAAPLARGVAGGAGYAPERLADISRLARPAAARPHGERAQDKLPEPPPSGGGFLLMDRGQKPLGPPKGGKGLHKLPPLKKAAAKKPARK